MRENSVCVCLLVSHRKIQNEIRGLGQPARHNPWPKATALVFSQVIPLDRVSIQIKHSAAAAAAAVACAFGCFRHFGSAAAVTLTKKKKSDSTERGLSLKHISKQHLSSADEAQQNTTTKHSVSTFTCAGNFSYSYGFFGSFHRTALCTSTGSKSNQSVCSMSCYVWIGPLPGWIFANDI